MGVAEIEMIPMLSVSFFFEELLEWRFPLTASGGVIFKKCTFCGFYLCFLYEFFTGFFFQTLPLTAWVTIVCSFDAVILMIFFENIVFEFFVAKMSSKWFFIIFL